MARLSLYKSPNICEAVLQGVAVAAMDFYQVKSGATPNCSDPRSGMTVKTDP